MLAVVIGLAFPISNLIFKPASVTVLSDRAGDDPHRVRVAEIFQKKCHYCHVPDAPLPFYASLPVAKQLMDYDVRVGTEWLDMSEEVFPQDGSPTPQPVLAKIE